MKNSLNVLIVVARFYDKIADMLTEGAVRKLQSYSAADVKHEVVSVPGSFEIPAAISFAIMSDRENYDGYVALGCVIKGLTTHHHHIATSISATLSDIAAQHVVPMGFGIITADTMDLAVERADMNKKDVGGSAAGATLRMIELYKRFLS